MVTRFSTSSAEEPGKEVVTVTISSLTDGNSSRGRENENRSPINIMAPINRFTKKEFLTEKSATCIESQPIMLSVRSIIIP